MLLELLLVGRQGQSNVGMGVDIASASIAVTDGARLARAITGVDSFVISVNNENYSHLGVMLAHPVTM